jgi:hypothetical protein
MRHSPFRGVRLLLSEHNWIRERQDFRLRPSVTPLSDPNTPKILKNRSAPERVWIDVMRYRTLVLLLLLAISLVAVLSACGGGSGGGY